MRQHSHFQKDSKYSFLRYIKQQNNDLFLDSCGHHICPAGHTYNHNIPTEYHLHFILKGNGIFKINNKTYNLGKNDIFLIPKGTAIEYQADYENPWEYFWITFDGTEANRYLSSAGLSEKNSVIHSKSPVKIYLPLLNNILLTHELNLANEVMRVGYLFQLLGTLIKVQADSNSNRNKLDYSIDAYVDYAIKHIQNNYQNTTVNETADYVGLNRSYLTSIFKKKLKTTPQEYLINYKLNRASELLKTTTLSINEIAYLVGYNDPLAFSKIFKQKYKMSPTSYRENNNV